MHKHETDLLTVFFAGGETKSTIYGKSPKEDRFAVGEVRFRSAGFTHSTENIGTDMFRAVIFEFASSMGTVNSTKPDDSLYCNAGSETVCVDEKYILCTDKMCVQEINIAPNAIWRNSESAKDQMLVAVSDYKLSSQIIKSKKVLKRKSGEVEYFSGGTAGQWKNIAKNSARFIVVLFR